MSLCLRMLSEHDVAKLVEALVESAERARGEGDAVGEAMFMRLSERIADALDEAVPGPGFAERVAIARERQAEARAARAAMRARAARFG